MLKFFDWENLYLTALMKETYFIIQDFPSNSLIKWQNKRLSENYSPVFDILFSIFPLRWSRLTCSSKSLVRAKDNLQAVQLYGFFNIFSVLCIVCTNLMISQLKYLIFLGRKQLWLCFCLRLLTHKDFTIFVHLIQCI